MVAQQAKGAPQPGGRSSQAARSSLPPVRQRAVHIRALLEEREFIKVSTFLLSRQMKARVVDLMERLRFERMDPDLRPSSGEPQLPEMTDGELLREIKWRIDTLPPGDTETVARYIRRITRWKAERRQKAARQRGMQGGPPAGLP